VKLDRRKVLLVAERDFRDAAGDFRLALAMAGLAAVVPVGVGFAIRALVVFGGGLTDLVQRVSIVGAFFVVFLPASYSLVLALESFVGERERATLEVLLSTPLREAEIYAGKVASVLGIALVLCFGALFVYCAVTFPGLGYFPLGILVSLGVSTICQVAAMVAGAVIVSANARTMRAANVMASFIILPMSVVLQVEAGLILVGRGELLWGFAAAMAVGAFILLRMGLRGFSREALLSRETGGRDRLRGALRAVAAAFRNAPSGPALLRARAGPILSALAAFPLGAVLGYLAAGLLFWWPAVGLDPSPWRMPHPVRAMYVFLQMPQNTFLAVTILNSSVPLYPHYATLIRPWGPTALQDQQIAGGLMWLCGDLLFLTAMGGIIAGWMLYEKRHEAALDRRVDRERAAIRIRETRLAERRAEERDGR